MALPTDGAKSLFFIAVQNFAARTQVWQPAIRYFTQPDENFDITLTSTRVYGSNDDWLTIMAAAGLDSVEQEMTQRQLTLPTLVQLNQMKADTGYSTSKFDGITSPV